MLLLAESGDEFRSRKTERELITCPPARDQKGYGYSLKPAFVLGANPAMGANGAPKYNALALHHAAPFAVTRWTNLYFPARFGIGRPQLFSAFCPYRS